MCGREGVNRRGTDSAALPSIAVRSERVRSRSIRKENTEVLPSVGGRLTCVGAGASNRPWDQPVEVENRGAACEAPDGTKAETVLARGCKILARSAGEER